jgi:hypothetical protein
MAKKHDLSDKTFSVCHAPLPLPPPSGGAYCFFTFRMKYIRESIGFTPKILKFFFCLKHVFYL